MTICRNFNDMIQYWYHSYVTFKNKACFLALTTSKAILIWHLEPFISQLNIHWLCSQSKE